MRIVRTLFWFLTIAALVSAGLLFFSQNLQSVVVEFVYWSSPKIPLALALLFAFGAGIFVAGLHFLLDVLRLRGQVRKSKRLAELLERELDALRNAPLYDELPSEPAATLPSFDRHLTHEGQPEASIDLMETKRFR
jgi:lipopolysaccharide assembly protein A